MDMTFLHEYIQATLMGIAQSAMVGAVTAWGEQRDTNRERAARKTEAERERLKPLISRIEQKLLSTLATLPDADENLKLLANDIEDPIFIQLLAYQIELCQFDTDQFIDRWIGARPHLEDHRVKLSPLISLFLDAVSSAIASDEELRGRLQLKMLGRIHESIGALGPPGATQAEAPAIPPLPVLQLACANASKVLLGWPISIEGATMESPVFTELAEAPKSNQSNVQVLLGSPGGGKSALLARLGQHFLTSGMTVLAIKADILPNSIETAADLGNYLGVGNNPQLSLRELACAGSVAVLIDQLDALADLADVRGGRLNAILHLIRDLAGIENLRVIASCRDFEHRHDARLAAIAADPTTLPLPTWEQVSNLLSDRGIRGKEWPESFREILRRPQQLSVFVKLVRSGEEMQVFTSYQHMLERLWLERVTNSGGLPGRSELLRDIARQMASEEVLWLSRARFDDRAPLLEQLIAAEILTTAEDERRVGFQHQTVFDFTLARSFASEEGSLMTFVTAREQSLFVRPRLWSALVYLRGVEFQTYRKQFDELWSAPNLKYHVRLQLVEFLGQLEDPDAIEEGILRSAIEHQSLRHTLLVAIAGRRKWFEILKSDILPKLMAEGDNLDGPLSDVLSMAASHHQSEVLTLIRDQWINRPEMDWRVASVLTYLQQWDEGAVNLAKVLVRRCGANTIHVFNVVGAAAASRADMAIAIFAPFVEARVVDLEAQSPLKERGDDKNSMYGIFNKSQRQYAAERLLNGDQSWPDLREMAEAAPASFLEHLWPFFLRILAATDDKDDSAGNHYHREWSIGLDARNGTEQLIDAIQTAVAVLAGADIPTFKGFLAHASAVDSITVQRILARALTTIAEQEPTLGMTYLLGDQRRFCLGDFRNEFRDTGALIEAISVNVSPKDIALLEETIGNWEPLRSPRQDLGPDVVDRLRRERKLRLWSYIPETMRSSHATSAIEAGEGEFPGLSRNDDAFAASSRGGFIGSPMSTEAMENATDDEVLAVANEVPDETDWEHPDDFFKGGSVQFSRAFADLAKSQPMRVVEFLRKFDPSKNTRPVAYALVQLSEAKIQPEVVFDLVRECTARGFRSLEFRVAAADTLRRMVQKGLQLPDDLFALLESWVPEIAAQTVGESPEEVNSEKDVSGTVLWRSSYSWMVPNGAYAALSALDMACRVAKQPDRFLTLLEHHLQQPERTVTWQAIAWHLDLIGYANHRRAANFMKELFRLHPGIRCSIPGFRAIAESFRWLPPETTREFLEEIRASESAISARGFGELIVFRHAFWDDAWATATVQDLLDGPTDPEVLAGMATSAVHVFAEYNARTKAGAVLKALVLRGEESSCAEVLDLFFLLPRLEPDPEMIEILSALLAQPHALIPDKIGFLIERLPDLIPNLSALAADLADRILDAHAEDLINSQMRLAGAASDLINLAFTLHRHEGAGRERGIALFERLLALNVAGTRQSLLEVDARPVSGPQVRFRPRRRLGPRPRQR